MKKPKLGQNFLVDDGARHRIADALGDVSQSTVVEIGPGHGAITNILAERAQRLLCVELDRSLGAELRFRFRTHPNVEIVEADILETDLSALTGQGERARVVGNLPYYITSDILLHLSHHAAAIDLAVVMMQREVAERVAAEPGTRDYGMLSVSVQLHAAVAPLFVLPPEAFAPPPEVYSTVLRLAYDERFASYGIDNEPAFTRFLRGCFQQKRKNLSNNLRAYGLAPELVQQVCTAAEIKPESRAETLTVDDLIRLYKAVAFASPSS